MVKSFTRADQRRCRPRLTPVDAVRHLIVTATGWGLNPGKDAIYLNVTPAKNDGTTIHKLEVKDRTCRWLLVDQPLRLRRVLSQERSERHHPPTSGNLTRRPFVQCASPADVPIHRLPSRAPRSERQRPDCPQCRRDGEP